MFIYSVNTCLVGFVLRANSRNLHGVLQFEPKGNKIRVGFVLMGGDNFEYERTLYLLGCNHLDSASTSFQYCLCT